MTDEYLTLTVTCKKLHVSQYWLNAAIAAVPRRQFNGKERVSYRASVIALYDYCQKRIEQCQFDIKASPRHKKAETLLEKYTLT